MVGSKCNLKMHVRNLGYPPYKSGPQNHLFRGLRNFTATLTAYIFGTKHYIHKRASTLQTIHGVSYIVSNRHELWSTNGFKLEVSFHPPSVNSAFHFIVRLRRRRLANRTLPNICWTKRDIDNRARALDTTKASSAIPNFHELWSINGLNPHRSFYPPSLPHYFVLSHRIPSMRH